MKKVLATVLAVFAVVCISANANAQGLPDQTLSAPGTLCEFYGIPGTDMFFTYAGGGANAIKNSNAAAKYVTCPIAVQQNAAYCVQTVTALTSATASGTQTTCALFLKRRDGTLAATSAAPTVTNPTATTRLHTWTKATTTEWDPGATWSVYCNVQPGMWVYNYAYTMVDRIDHCTP